VTFSIWEKEKLCQTGFVSTGIGIFQLKTGGLKLLCVLVCWHGAKADCIFKIQVFFLDSLLRVLLKTSIHMAE
jgi:hypothetical protein